MAFGFKDYLKEQKNTHMEHLEDLVFNEGMAGTNKAIKFLEDLKSMLSGNATTKVSATVKWDGAPAIFAGIDPRDGKFFVAKKGVFNKDPKVYKTAADINADVSGDLAAKLKVALVELKKLGITKGVFQGDLMFTKSDLKTEKIDGQSYLTFHPNTIVYAVPLTSNLATQIKKANMGIVWHTSYEGSSFETMRASFGKSIMNQLKKSPSVWMDDANYKDYSGTATFTKAETKAIETELTKAKALANSLNAKMVDDIHQDEDLLTQIKTYNNTKVREGEEITNTRAHVAGLFHYIHDKYQKEIDSKKTEKAKSAWEEKRKNVLKYFSAHDQNEIIKIFELTNLITSIKRSVITKMNQAGHINTFLKTTNGFKVTGVEGFVAIDHLSGNAVKIVDRLEFSKSNFSPDIIKGWQK